MATEEKEFSWQHPDYEEPGPVLGWLKVCVHADDTISMEFENNSNVPAERLVEKIKAAMATVPEFSTKPMLRVCSNGEDDNGDQG